MLLTSFFIHLCIFSTNNYCGTKMFFLMYPLISSLNHGTTTVLFVYWSALYYVFMLSGCLKTYLKKVLFNYASNLTPDFKEALQKREKIKLSQPEREENQVSVVLRSNHRK